MAVAVVTFVKQEALDSILSEGFKPSESRRSYDRRKKEAKMNQVVGVDPDASIVYGIAVDEDLADLGHITHAAALHGQVALVWRHTNEYTTTCTCGDSLCGTDHENAVAFSYRNFLEKKKELIKLHKKFGRSVQTAYVEVQLRSPDPGDAEIVHLSKSKSVAEIMGDSPPKEEVDIRDFL